MMIKLDGNVDLCIIFCTEFRLAYINLYILESHLNFIFYFVWSELDMNTLLLPKTLAFYDFINQNLSSD